MFNHHHLFRQLPERKGKMKRLVAAYPGMDEHFLESVLSSCGYDIRIRGFSILKLRIYCHGLPNGSLKEKIISKLENR